MAKSPAERPALTPHPAADKAAALALTPVSRETEARLDRYVDLLRGVAGQDQSGRALDASKSLDPAHRRFAAAPDLAPSAKIWVDLGSGGGFPGVVLACALAETPGAHVHLVERNAKKAAFLREAVRVTVAPGPCISLTSGILWIESQGRSIASPRGRWLRYISSSASRNRW